MKRISLLLLLLSLTQLGEAQTFNQLYTELKDATNATKMEVNRTLLFFANMFEDTMGVKRVKLLSLDSCNDQQVAQIESAMRDGDESRFSLLLSVNEEGERTRIYTHLEEERIRELVVLSLDGDFAYVHIEGDIDINDVERITQTYEQQ